MFRRTFAADVLARDRALRADDRRVNPRSSTKATLQIANEVHPRIPAGARLPWKKKQRHKNSAIFVSFSCLPTRLKL